MISMFRQIYKKVMWALENNLPANLTYHNAIHTKYVLEKATLIAEKENISGHELLLLKIAALYHDTGFTIHRKSHESLSCKIACQELKEFGMEEQDIALISGMIMATQIPQRPKTKLEKILADADLEYLATRYFNYFSQKLYEEILSFQPFLSLKQWNEIQIEFISNHTYHTCYCRKYKEPLKIKNLENIKRKSVFPS